MPKNYNIYIDNAATSRPNRDVLDVYNKVNDDFFANSSSVHFLGAESLNLFENAKNQILKIFGLNNHEVIFTSGSTEAINLAIKGYCLNNRGRGNHIITSNYEHPAVSESIKQLQEIFGFQVTYLQVDENGHISLDELTKSIKKETILVSIMAVNNETGSINDIEQISSILSKYPKIALFSDTTQAIGKIVLNYNAVDMFSVAGHKIHGLKGTGCLIKKKNISLLPINSGGGQQNGIRNGTDDVGGAVSLAKAIRISFEEIKNNFEKISVLQKHLLSFLSSKPDLFKINSSLENPYIVNFSTLNRKSSVVVEALSNEGIYASTISACHSKKEQFSTSVFAITKDNKLASNTIRVSFSKENTIEEVEILEKELLRIMGEIKQ